MSCYQPSPARLRRDAAEAIAVLEVARINLDQRAYAPSRASEETSMGSCWDHADDHRRSSEAS